MCSLPHCFNDLHVRSPATNTHHQEAPFDGFFVHLQLLPADSFAIKLRAASEHHDIFIVLGCLNVGGISTLGVATLFVPAWPQLIADVAAVLGVFVAVGGFPLAGKEV